MIPFSPPRIDKRIIEEVTDALQSGWITTGPKTKLFEKKLEEYCGAEKVLCLNSATAGLELMLRWFGVKEGDEVIIPAYTYAATANVVMHCGAKPVMVDINKDDFNINVDLVRKAITPRTKVIMPVDIGGLPCDYDSLYHVVNDDAVIKHFTPTSEEQKKLGRIMILSDAAHSLGATYKGRKAGVLADCTVFSFHAVKNLTTAEGGAVCLTLKPPFSNTELYRLLNIKALHGQNKDALAKTQKGAWEYDIVEAGYKWNMPDVLAAIGLVELDRYEDDTLKRRKWVTQIYRTFFKEYDWAELPCLITEDKASCSHLFMLRIKNITLEQRNEIIKEIFDNNVSVNVHFKPLPLMTYYKNLGYKIEDYPVAYDNFCREISLPVYYNLSVMDLKTVVDAVLDSYEKIIK